VEEKLAKPVPNSPFTDSTVGSATRFILVYCLIGIFFARFLFVRVRSISLTTHNENL
jgi:hypothetical protein